MNTFNCPREESRDRAFAAPVPRRLAASLLLLASCCLSVAQPANDGFAGAKVIAGTDGTSDDSSVGASKEPGEPNHAGNAGGKSIWYRWESPITGIATFDTFGSSFDTLMAAYSGSTVDALASLASNNNAGSAQSRIIFRIVAGATYHLAVDGFNGAAGNVTLNWSSQPPPANDNFASPLDLTGSGGYVIDTSAGATKEAGEPNHAGKPGGASVWFRWSSPISGPVSFNTFSSAIADTVLGVYTGSSVDSNSLTLVATNDNANPASGRLWSRVVFNAAAGQQYRIALDSSAGEFGFYQLTWGFGVPGNNDFANAVSVSTMPNSTTGLTVLATKQAGEPSVGTGGAAGGASIWYKWRPDINGPAAVSTFGSLFDTLLGVYTGSDVASLTPVGVNDDAFNTRQSRVAFTAVAGTQYFIAVDGYYSQEGVVRFNWAAGAPSNNSFAAAVPLNGLAGVVNGINDFATKEAGEPNHAGRQGTNSVWYRWSPPASGVATISLAGSLFDTLLAVYSGTAVGSLTEVASNDDFAGTLQSQVRFIAQQGVTYQIAVDGFGGTQGPLTLSYALDPPPTLQIQRDANRVVIHWAGPYRLESASTLARPVTATVWTPVPGGSPATLPAQPANLFFRAAYP